MSVELNEGPVDLNNLPFDLCNGQAIGMDEARLFCSYLDDAFDDVLIKISEFARTELNALAHKLNKKEHLITHPGHYPVHIGYKSIEASKHLINRVSELSSLTKEIITLNNSLMNQINEEKFINALTREVCLKNINGTS